MQFSITNQFYSQDPYNNSKEVPVPHVAPGLYIMTLKLDVAGSYYGSGPTDPVDFNVQVLGKFLGGQIQKSNGLNPTNFTKFWFAELINVTEGKPQLRVQTSAHETGNECQIYSTLFICLEKVK